MPKKLFFEHLKDFSSSEGYWSTTDCYDVAKDIITLTKAKSMLEIGFNIGYSAAVWLESGIDTLAVIDINNHKHTEPALKATKSAYPNKNILWLLENSTSDKAKEWSIPDVDIAFVDGGHTYDICASDSLLAISKGAKWLVYDDAIEAANNGVWRAIKELKDKNTIEVVSSYPMTWVGNGSVILARVV